MSTNITAADKTALLKKCTCCSENNNGWCKRIGSNKIEDKYKHCIIVNENTVIEREFYEDVPITTPKVMSKNNRISKTTFYLDLAFIVAKRSTCKRREIGAIIVHNDDIIAYGYNGAISGEVHCIDTKCNRDSANSGKEMEKCVAVHAEQNAIIKAVKKLHNNFSEMTLYCTHKPCNVCEKLIASLCFKEVIYVNNYGDDTRENYTIANTLFKKYFRGF